MRATLSPIQIDGAALTHYTRPPLFQSSRPLRVLLRNRLKPTRGRQQHLLLVGTWSESCRKTYLPAPLSVAAYGIPSAVLEVPAINFDNQFEPDFIVAPPRLTLLARYRLDVAFIPEERHIGDDATHNLNLAFIKRYDQL